MNNVEEKTGRGIVIIDNNLVTIKRTKVKDKKEKIYYTIPGGHVEENENYEETIIREIFEELGISVKVNEEFLHIYNEDLNREEAFYNCEYISGNIGTGTGPEWGEYHEEYGKYDIELININDISEYNILPIEVKNKLIKEYSN